MKTLLIFVLLLGVAHADSSDPIQGSVRDEVLSQQYEGLYLDGEDKEHIEDMMTQDGVTPEDLELQEYSEDEE